MTLLQEAKLRRKDAAIYLQVSVPTLARWASKSIGPTYYVWGGRAWYVRQDLDAFVEARRRGG